MKKSTFLFALAMLALASACHQPEYVQPTADRQGITSLAAYFAFGPYEGQELGRLEIADPDVDRYVIPIPWYFPETSDDITTPYLTRVRVRASLEANCKIEPALSVLDLTEENHFTYTDATGTSRNIIITGERVKSSKCELLSFSLKRPMLNGIIDKSTRQVSLITANDLSVAEATVTLSAHATISPDPAEAHNYNEGFTFTVTADDGTTKADYYVVKNVPQKIDYGVNTTSAEKLFNLDPSSGLGLPAFNTQANVSLAVLDSWLIVNMGDGSAPKYFNKIMATAGGTLKIGNAVPTGAIASDEQDHLLLCNLAEPGEVFNIWKTSSVSQAPELLYSFTNNQDLQLGLEMKVIGDVEKEAVISVTYPGLAGVTTSGRSAEKWSRAKSSICSRRAAEPSSGVPVRPTAPVWWPVRPGWMAAGTAVPIPRTACAGSNRTFRWAASSPVRASARVKTLRAEAIMSTAMSIRTTWIPSASITPVIWCSLSPTTSRSGGPVRNSTSLTSPTARSATASTTVPSWSSRSRSCTMSSIRPAATKDSALAAMPSWPLRPTAICFTFTTTIISPE